VYVPGASEMEYVPSAFAEAPPAQAPVASYAVTIGYATAEPPAVTVPVTVCVASAGAFATPMKSATTTKHTVASMEMSRPLEVIVLASLVWLTSTTRRRHGDASSAVSAR
jgi:hypothetical protein